MFNFKPFLGVLLLACVVLFILAPIVALQAPDPRLARFLFMVVLTLEALVLARAAVVTWKWRAKPLVPTLGIFAAALMLSGCAGLPFTGNPSVDAKNAATQLSGTLSTFNTAAAQNCSGTGELDWAPPFPPTGSLHVRCVIGPQMVPLSQLSDFLAKGGAFGGGGASATVPVVPPMPAAPAADAPK